MLPRMISSLCALALLFSSSGAHMQHEHRNLNSENNERPMLFQSYQQAWNSIAKQRNSGNTVSTMESACRHRKEGTPGSGAGKGSGKAGPSKEHAPSRKESGKGSGKAGRTRGLQESPVRAPVRTLAPVAATIAPTMHPVLPITESGGNKKGGSKKKDKDKKHFVKKNNKEGGPKHGLPYCDEIGVKPPKKEGGLKKNKKKEGGSPRPKPNPRPRPNPSPGSEGGSPGSSPGGSPGGTPPSGVPGSSPVAEGGASQPVRTPVATPLPTSNVFPSPSSSGQAPSAQAPSKEGGGSRTICEAFLSGTAPTDTASIPFTVFMTIQTDGSRDTAEILNDMQQVLQRDVAADVLGCGRLTGGDRQLQTTTKSQVVNVNFVSMAETRTLC